jgi:hypothetical protein
LAIRRHPASIVGTHANRMIHSETNQLLIGPYVIDAKGEVRLIKQLASERLTGTMRHLTDPAGKVYYLAMEGGFYEVDLATLQARKLFELTKELGIESRVHFKGGYTAQGRVVVANNSYFEEDQRDGHGRGRLAEWDGQRWTILRRTAFCDVTTAASIQPPPRDHSTLWANGWDRRSVLLCILQDGRWHTYRLPKASQSYDQAWCTEWPRIRPLWPDLMLLDMHGLYYKMSAQLRPGQMGGLTPYAAHLKMTPDFCLWQDRLVLAGDENSSMNHRHRTGGQPQSNLWFGTLEEIGRWGRPAGWGGPWLDDPVQPDTPSDPFLIAGFEHRCLHLAAQPITQTTQSSPLPWRERPASANWPGEILCWESRGFLGKMEFWVVHGEAPWDEGLGWCSEWFGLFFGAVLCWESRGFLGKMEFWVVHGEAPWDEGLGWCSEWFGLFFGAVAGFLGRGVFWEMGVPGLAGPEDGVEEDQEFPHTGHQGHFGRFACLAEAVVELLDDGIEAGGSQGSHVEDVSDLEPAAPDGPMAMEASAVPVQGCDADQGGDLASIELSEFGQVGQQTSGRLLPDAGHTAEQLLLGLPDGRLLDELADFRLDASDLPLEVLEQSLDALPDDAVGFLLEADFFGGLELDELVSPSGKFFQEQELLIGQGPDFWREGFGH